MVEQCRCGRSEPPRGCRSPGGPSWVSRAEGQSSPASTGTGTLATRGWFIFCQPAQQIQLTEEFAYKPSLCNNKMPFPESFFSGPHQHFKTHLRCNWHLCTADFRNVLLWRKDWSTEVLIPPPLAALGVVCLAGNVRDEQHAKELQQMLFSQSTGTCLCPARSDCRGSSPLTRDKTLAEVAQTSI